ncbi:MAG: MFS transporter [Betaproteobacteria bacterium]|jgi:MFS family permease|nr:MFS transporter [Betaproteobacteria bacterium]
MEHARRNIFLLACCQALLFTNNVTLIALNGLAGFALADNKVLATLPVTGYVVGAALATFPASLWMKRVGRRNGFLTGTAFGIAGGAIATLGIYLSSFWTLVAGTLVLGAYNAFGQYYRFAAADASPLPWKAKAISLVMAGGLVGGIIGPEMSKVTRDLVQPTFLASYASLIGFCLVTMAILAGLRIPDPKGDEAHGASRPLKEIMAQPVFVVAVVVGALGYGVMNLLMTSTPLAMGFCGHPYAAAASVISAHVIAMFGPSFFTGSLIQRFGVLNVMLAGVAAMFACVAIALSGQLVTHFWWSLVLLGVGWNFMYVGGTTLLTEAYRPAEKAKTQGANEILVFCTTATSSFTSGVLVNAAGWNTLNYVALPFLVIAGSAAVWLALRRRAAPALS